MTRIEAVSYIVDDLPDESSIVQDMAFFEQNFKGVMPLEIIIDTGKEQGVRKPENLQKVNELEIFLKELPHVSPPVSIVSFLKAANQAYFNGNPASYQLPGKREAAFVQRYIKGKGDVSDLGNSFLDSTGQLMRISLKVADLGSVRMDSLISHQISPKIDELFDGTDLSARITGSTLLFIKGNSYLIDNMKNSLMLAIVIIGCIIGVLFKNIRIMLITIASNLLPLILTAGMMGYFGIPLKPSTALIFSIAFGIAVDDSIHFLAKYRQELKSRNYDILESIRLSIQETGLSMIYTSIVLFGGFIIFVGSDFGGTVALGLLTSATLLVAMTTNLVLLPSLLISFARGREDAATDDDDDVMNDYDANLDEEENGNSKS
jgi:predicted RND superfamily exporter protein